MLFQVYLVTGQEYFPLYQDEQFQSIEELLTENFMMLPESALLIRKQLPKYNWLETKTILAKYFIFSYSREIGCGTLQCLCFWSSSMETASS